MTYDIRLHIDQNTPEGRVIEQVIQAQHLSPEEAVRNVLRQRANKTPAEAMLGAFSSQEDAALMDEVMELADARRRADQPRDFGF
jgi:hypothetical protein